MLVTTILLAILAPNGGSAPLELEARHWFNNPVFRLNDDRRVFVVCFDCDKPESRSALRKLNRLARKPSVVVIGLTRDKREDCERFIRANRIAFTIGAESETVRQLKPRRLPAIYELDRAQRESEPNEIDSLDLIVPNWDDIARQQIEQMEEWELRAFVESDALGLNRCVGVERLWGLLGADRAEEFVQYLDSLIETEEHPWVRGRMRHLQWVAKGLIPLQDAPSESTAAFLEFRQNPDADEWRKVRDFKSRMSAMPVTELLDTYRRNAGPARAGALIRRLVTDQLSTAGDRAAARTALLEIVAADPDHSVRLHAAGGLAQVCEVGDTVVADVLESLAQSEPHVKNVRPAMEYASQYLRTGATIDEAAASKP
ncbi:MAG: hypothetical protein CHACPFDD_01503 [Phycisphaerae bacterium]|nr:hypothetical protein [Phycisphaerae bacterium]